MTGFPTGKPGERIDPRTGDVYYSAAWLVEPAGSAGDVDGNGDVVDTLQERLRRAIDPDSPIDVELHLRRIVGAVRGRTR